MAAKSVLAEVAGHTQLPQVVTVFPAFSFHMGEGRHHLKFSAHAAFQVKCVPGRSNTLPPQQYQ